MLRTAASTFENGQGLPPPQSPLRLLPPPSAFDDAFVSDEELGPAPADGFSDDELEPWPALADNPFNEEPEPSLLLSEELEPSQMPTHARTPSNGDLEPSLLPNKELEPAPSSSQARIPLNDELESSPPLPIPVSSQNASPSKSGRIPSSSNTTTIDTTQSPSLQPKQIKLPSSEEMRSLPLPPSLSLPPILGTTFIVPPSVMPPRLKKASLSRLASIPYSSQPSTSDTNQFSPTEESFSKNANSQSAMVKPSRTISPSRRVKGVAAKVEKLLKHINNDEVDVTNLAEDNHDLFIQYMISSNSPTVAPVAKKFGINVRTAQRWWQKHNSETKTQTPGYHVFRNRVPNMNDQIIVRPSEKTTTTGKAISKSSVSTTEILYPRKND